MQRVKQKQALHISVQRYAKEDWVHHQKMKVDMQ